MTDLAVQLERLGLEQYLDTFIGEGFDNWDILCDIQESDLETLNVKLGHRRKLQRAIAEYRGISYERLIGSPAAQEGPSDTSRLSEGSSAVATGKESSQGPTAEVKRKYRRHPRPDDNAPEKPPSAYVLFSNKVREEIKAENYSFTEIAKLVGDRWQKLDPAQKDPFESQAASLKEHYNVQLSMYKKTDAFKEYAQYLSDFKAKHGPQTDTKRPKLDPQSSGGSVSTTSVEIADTIPVTAGHARVGSVGSLSGTSLTSAMTSPTTISLAPAPPMSVMSAIGSRALPGLPRPPSPQISHYVRQSARVPAGLSAHSSTSEDSGQVSIDTISRTATLSLSTPPTGTPPLPTHALGNVRIDQSTSGDAYAWGSRPTQQLHQAGPPTPSAPSPLGSGITLPSPTFPNEGWRERAIEWTRPVQISTINTGAPASGLGLPPLLGADRMIELGHGHAQRILPPLRQSTPSTPQTASYPGGQAVVPQLRQATTTDSERGYPQLQDVRSNQLERNENEAASALAGLAARSGTETPTSRGYERRRP